MGNFFSKDLFFFYKKNNDELIEPLLNIDRIHNVNNTEIIDTNYRLLSSNNNNSWIFNR